jgi:hypothetical protein
VMEKPCPALRLVSFLRAGMDETLVAGGKGGGRRGRTSPKESSDQTLFPYLKRDKIFHSANSLLVIRA